MTVVKPIHVSSHPRAREKSHRLTSTASSALGGSPRVTNGYPCSRCTQRFNTPMALRVHQTKVHRTPASNAKVHYCHYEGCTRAGPFTAANLALHTKVHTQPLELECTYCDRKFNRKENLIRHARIILRLLARGSQRQPLAWMSRECGRGTSQSGKIYRYNR